MEEKKKRQHYVWRYYLTAWENENGKLSCLRNNKVFTASARDVANIRNFYRLNELSLYDIQVITTLFIDGYGPPEVQEANKNWMKQFNQIFEYKRKIEQSGDATEKVNEKIDILINNIEENFHSNIEDIGKPYLELLRNGDASFYQDDERKFDFNYFICTQYFRTNMLKNNVLRAIRSIPVPPPPDLNVDKVWNVSKFIFITNLAFQMSLSSNNFICQILINKTTTPFITGDQPVINTKAEYDSEEQTNEMELYYPISLTIALLVKKGSPLDNESIDVEESEVQKYNNLIFKASEEQIYANDPAILNSFNVADREQ